MHSGASRWGRIARGVPSRNTVPERVVRSVLHGMGYRFRLHGEGLPGKPDIVFPPRRKAIFVNGCFWHDHGCRPAERRVRTNAAFWESKFARTAARDARHTRELETAEWDVLVVWECEVEDVLSLALRLRTFLGPPSAARRRPRA